MKRIASLLLCIAVCAASIPLPVRALEMSGGTANVNVGIKTGDFIYYGKDQDCKWRVLDAEAGNAVGTEDVLLDGQETVANDQAIFVISEACMGTGEYGDVRFNEDYTKGNAYQESDAQRWCEDFTKNQLTAEEQSALLAVTKDDSECNVNEELYSASENILNGDRIFFLSAEEANTYFDDKGDRVADYNGADGGWWLRSPSSVFSSNAGLINMYGGISKSNVSNDWAARPAFDLNRNAVLFSSAASGGKSSGEAGVDALEAIGAYEGKEWKLTIRDDQRSAFAVGTIKEEAQKLTVAYAGARCGADEYISAVVADGNGTYTHYGRIKKITDSSQAKGTVELALPADIKDTDRLYIFNEQYHGDYKTDYASALQEVSRTKNAYTVTNQLTDLTTDYDGDAVLPGEDYEAVYRTESEGYMLPETIQVTVGGNLLSQGQYTYQEGKLTIPKAQITGDIVITASSVKKTWEITVGHGEGTFDGKYTFAEKHEDYAPLEAQTFTITNTGNQPITDLKVGLEERTSSANGAAEGTADAGNAFLLTQPNDTLPAGGETDFTVQPETALSAGTYEAKVKISGEHSVEVTPQEISVAFTVDPHTYGTWAADRDSDGAGDTHTRRCTDAACAYTETEKCSGGTANYFQKAVCQECNEPYGTLLEDQEKPEGTITVQAAEPESEKLEFKELAETIQFQNFYPSAPDIQITATDNSYESTDTTVTAEQKVRITWLLDQGEEGKAQTADELEKRDAEFQSYQEGNSIPVLQDGRYVLYVKLTDYQGNVNYISTNGIVLDSKEPTIDGIVNGKIYCQAAEVSVTDENLQEVTLNDEKVELTNHTFTVNPREGAQTITATDKAGNCVTYQITVNDGHTPEADDDDCTTAVKCSVCQEIAIAAKEHAYTGEWQNDTKEHWRECQNDGCQVSETKAAHTYGTDGTAAACTVCGYTRDREETPNIIVDYRNEKLTGFVKGVSYTINGKEVEPENGELEVHSYLGTDIAIIRKASDSDTKIDSDAQTLNVPARPEAPSVKAVDESAALKGDGKITGTTDKMEYQSAGETDWKECSNQEVTGLQPGEYQVRLKVTDSSFVGEEARVTIKAGAQVNAEQPIISKDLSTEEESYFVGAEAEKLVVEVSVTDGGTLSYQWYARKENDSEHAEKLTGETKAEYQPSTETEGTFYYYCIITNTLEDCGDGGNKTASVSSKTAKITVKAKVKEETPNIIIDYRSEKLTGFAEGVSYTINGKEVEPENGELEIHSYLGTDIAIIREASDSDTKIDSDAQTLNVPARPEAPSVEAVDESAALKGDGKITGTTDKMEYQSAGESDWKECSDQEVTGLQPGEYQVRIKVTDSSFVGEVTRVTIKTGAQVNAE